MSDNSALVILGLYLPHCEHEDRAGVDGQQHHHDPSFLHYLAEHDETALEMFQHLHMSFSFTNKRNLDDF